MSPLSLPLDLPGWAIAFDDPALSLGDDDARMRFTIDLAGKNVEQGTGGPFAAAIFERDSGRLVAIGVNSVVRLGSSVLHAEMMAILRAQSILGTYTLKHPDHVLYASSEPCAMCLGGLLWSGIRRLVYAAPAAAAQAIGFDEGPVYPESYRHLEHAGIEVTPGVLADAATAIICRYRQQGGIIYNG